MENIFLGIVNQSLVAGWLVIAVIIFIFAFIGVYLLSVIDAYVDAELSNFDITPDLSMKVEPAVIDNRINNSSNRSVGLQCSFRF